MYTTLLKRLSGFIPKKPNTSSTSSLHPTALQVFTTFRDQAVLMSEKRLLGKKNKNANTNSTGSTPPPSLSKWLNFQSCLLSFVLECLEQDKQLESIAHCMSFTIKFLGLIEMDGWVILEHIM